MMNYNQDIIRRQDRLLSEQGAIHLLRHGEYGILSMVAQDQQGYGIPLNFVWDGQQALYFHSAPEGQKLECLKTNNHVSFCVVGRTKVLSDQFTTEYESIVVKGSIQFTLSEDEKRDALVRMLDKYSPQDKTLGLKYVEKSFHRTAVMRLDIERVSGKCKQLHR